MEAYPEKGALAKMGSFLAGVLHHFRALFLMIVGETRTW